MRLLLPAILLCSLSACFEIEEKIDIHSNGSGQMTVNTDMSQMLTMMESYLGKDEMDKQMPRKAVDTTILMKDMVDTAKKMSAENRALLRDGRIHLVLNLDQKVFRADMHFPFSSLANLQKLYAAMNDGTLNTAEIFKGLSSGKQESGDATTPEMNQYNSIYHFECKDGMISRKLDETRWKELQQTPQFDQLKQTASMGIDMPYTLVINLPRPLKKVDNSLAVVSPDKKTVTIKYNLTEVFQTPEKFEYTIAY